MGRTKKMLEEIVSLDIEREKFENLCQKQGLEVNRDFKIKKVAVPEYPYHEFENWRNQKKIADAAYRKLKEIEYGIIHNKAYESGT